LLPVDQLARLANDTEFGLAGTVWSADVDRATTVARAVQTGTIGVNDYALDVRAPFGGVGSSGTGARHGGPQANLEAFTDTQWVTVRGTLPQYPF